jgi:hypothetical protein
MKTKNFALRFVGTIFGLVSILHLLRLISGVSVEIADWPLPIWVNVLGFIATAFLCTMLWWLSFQKEKLFVE